MRPEYNHWMATEARDLAKYYPNTPPEALLVLFPKHTLKSIYSQANKMGLKKSKEYISATRSARSKSYVAKVKTKSQAIVTALNEVHVLLKAGRHEEALKAAETAVKALDQSKLIKDSI